MVVHHRLNGLGDCPQMLMLDGLITITPIRSAALKIDDCLGTVPPRGGHVSSRGYVQIGLRVAGKIAPGAPRDSCRHADDACAA